MQIEPVNIVDEANPGSLANYKALVRLSILLDAQPSLDQLVELIVRECNTLLKADRTTLFLIDSERKELYSKFGLGLENRQIRLPLGRGIAGTVAFTGQSIFSKDTQNDPRHAGDQFGYLTRIMLTVPLRTSNGLVIGVLQVLNKLVAEFDAHDQQILEILAEMAANAIERTKRFNQQQQLSQQLVFQARHDALTGLPNRMLLEESLHQAILIAASKQHQLAVLIIDLDRFKVVNDSLSHSLGDALLCQVAQRLQANLRQGDMVARLGGDEFAVVLGVVRVVEHVLKFTQKLLKALQQPFYVEGHELYVTASVGVSLYPAHGQTAAEILRRADSAMYRVKGQGKNNYYFFSPEINEDEQKNLWLVTQLHKALEYSELILYYQPQLNLANGLISGVEALIRWNHRELGLVSPGNFIPIAEETGLIIPIGAWVMEQSCLQAKRWQTQGYKPMRMSVNVSAIQFNRDDFVELVVQSLEKSDLDPIWLELELTEGLLFGNTQATIAKLEQLKQLGVSLAIDDFGTGYSSLHYLQQLPIDTLKIDQFFVRSLTDDRLESSKGLALIKTIINLGHNLNMTIIAEGVETNSQLEYLKELNCDEIQGYLFSKPRSVPEFETFMSESSILGLVRKEKRYEKVT